jgi:hypothetical protein
MSSFLTSRRATCKQLCCKYDATINNRAGKTPSACTYSLMYLCTRPTQVAPTQDGKSCAALCSLKPHTCIRCRRAAQKAKQTTKQKKTPHRTTTDNTQQTNNDKTPKENASICSNLHDAMRTGARKLCAASLAKETGHPIVAIAVPSLPIWYRSWDATGTAPTTVGLEATLGHAIVLPV